jgi:hypothetical protein
MPGVHLVNRLQPCYDGRMKYEVDLPADIDKQLSAKASETGSNVAHLIRLAVDRFIDEQIAGGSNGQWSQEAECRRRELIDRDIACTITSEERAELVRLDRLANEHFDRIAPPPTQAARQLHGQLVKNRARRK